MIVNQLDPKIAKQIAESPGGKEFIEFIQGEVEELDKLSGVVCTEPSFRYLAEVRGKQIAVLMLKRILESLINYEIRGIMPPDNKEYNVDIP